ncbi:MAG: hypothetical protein K2Y30_03030 [Flavobacteriaceae bacterium]|nr:hypothetical protein [Flavobacteriaceae bacterium]
MRNEVAYSSFNKSNGFLFVSGQIGTVSVKGVKNFHLTRKRTAQFSGLQQFYT